jgi:hypothetical protein
LLRIAHDPGVRLRDVGGVVRATLERSPREQPAHEFPIVDLQVQRHIRGHPRFVAYQVSRAGLVRVPWDSVEDKPASGRRPAPAAPCRAQPGRARVRPGRDTSGRPGRGGPPRHVIAQEFAGRDMGDVEVRGGQRALSPFARPRRPRPARRPARLAEALSRVLAGQCPDPGPGRAYARQFIPSAAAAVYIGAYRHLLASRATLRHPGTAATPATNSPAAADTPT